MAAYTITTEKNKQATTVKLEGNLTVANINKISKELNKAVANAKKAEINVLNVDETDVSFFQVLIALKNTALANKNELNIKLNLTGEQNNILTRSGIINLFK